MRFSLLPDGSVQLSHLNDWELRTLRSLPGIAEPGDDEAALRRLYPAPFEAGETTQEQREDWAELVQPDLEQLFESSLSRVADDVRTAHLEPPQPRGENGDDEIDGPLDDDNEDIEEGPGGDAEPEDDDPPEFNDLTETPPRWQFTIPAAHIDDWYRTMNQARLMLSTKHEAHRTDDEHIARLLTTGRIEPMIQYELFTALCGWWVEVLMRGN